MEFDNWLIVQNNKISSKYIIHGDLSIDSFINQTTNQFEAMALIKSNLTKNSFF